MAPLPWEGLYGGAHACRDPDWRSRNGADRVGCHRRQIPPRSPRHRTSWEPFPLIEGCIFHPLRTRLGPCRNCLAKMLRLTALLGQTNCCSATRARPVILLGTCPKAAKAVIASSLLKVIAGRNGTVRSPQGSTSTLSSVRSGSTKSPPRRRQIESTGRYPADHLLPARNAR